MAFNVNEFRTEIANKGLMRNNKFLVRIAAPPPILNSSTNSAFYTNKSKNLEFWCEGSTIPGVSILTSNIRRYGYGVAEKKPDGANFPDIRLNFIVDENAEVVNYFRDWTKSIINYVYIPGMNSNSYEIAYKNDYVTDIDIISFKEDGMTPIETLQLRKAFPIDVGNINLSWSNNNEITRLPITMTFYDWVVKK